MENVDETIKNICEWIQKELSETNSLQGSNVLPEMTKALAELVSARASAYNQKQPISIKKIQKELDIAKRYSNASVS